MFQLNDDFLKELGLDGMPEEQRKPFLTHIYSELELRVGERLSQGMSDAQLDEFANIIDKVPGAVDAFLEKYSPNYMEDQIFQRLSQATGLAMDDPRLKDEYSATKWLEVNRPDYRDVVTAVMGELKQEILANREAILGSVAQQQSVAQPQPAQVTQGPTGQVPVADPQATYVAQDDGSGQATSQPQQDYAQPDDDDQQQ